MGVLDVCEYARPLVTALTMVAKLSSARIMEAASLDTSVPVTPMATPMSALFEGGGIVHAVAGHGHDPSQRCQAETMRILCSGDTRA